MSKGHISASYLNKNFTIHVRLTLYIWEEDGTSFVYSPALDLTGYGNTEQEAKESFRVVLDEFIKYTNNKQTIWEELENLGWTVNRKKKKVHSPSIDELLSENESFKELYAGGKFKEESENVELELI